MSSTREYQRMWREANPDKTAAYNAKRRKPPVIKQCAHCGDTIIGRVDKQFCSHRCSHQARKHIYVPPHRSERRHPCTCTVCHTPFIGFYGGKFCSPECRISLRSWPSCEVKWRICHICLTYFANPRRKKACSTACAREAKLRYDRTNKPQSFVAGYCGECEKPFIAARLNTKFCSTTCERRHGRRLRKHRRDKRIRDQVRRDSISLPKLAARDGFRCHICHRLVNRRTWSVDHLIPLVEGGSHTWENVSLAHHRCNSLRGQSGAAQLRVWGGT